MSEYKTQDGKWVLSVSPWDSGDYIVTIRPAGEKLWHDKPIGPLVSERTGVAIAQWLADGGLYPLFKIGENISKD